MHRNSVFLHNSQLLSSNPKTIWGGLPLIILTIPKNPFHILAQEDSQFSSWNLLNMPSPKEHHSFEFLDLVPAPPVSSRPYFGPPPRLRSTAAAARPFIPRRLGSSPTGDRGDRDRVTTRRVTTECARERVVDRYSREV